MLQDLSTTQYLLGGAGLGAAFGLVHVAWKTVDKVVTRSSASRGVCAAHRDLIGWLQRIEHKVDTLLLRQ